MELIVRYFTMTDVHVHNISRLPKPELQHAQGERIMEQVRPRVSPIQVRMNPSTTMEAWAYTVGRAKKNCLTVRLTDQKVSGIASAHQ